MFKNMNNIYLVINTYTNKIVHQPLVQIIEELFPWSKWSYQLGKQPKENDDIEVVPYEGSNFEYAEKKGILEKDAYVFAGGLGAKWAAMLTSHKIKDRPVLLVNYDKGIYNNSAWVNHEEETAQTAPILPKGQDNQEILRFLDLTGTTRDAYESILKIPQSLGGTRLTLADYELSESFSKVDLFPSLDDFDTPKKRLNYCRFS